MKTTVTTILSALELEAHISDCGRLAAQEALDADRALDDGANYFAATGARHAAELKENGFTPALSF